MDPYPQQIRCGVCGGDEMEDADDGFFYCRICGSRVEDIIDTGVADEDFVDKTGGLSHGGGALYLASHKRKAHSVGCPTPLSFHVKTEESSYDAVGPTEPADFGSPWKGAVAREEDYCKVIRRRYIVGLQKMIQLQCEALVEKFKVTPLICGIAASVWLRFVASTRVHDDRWADQAVVQSESQGEKQVEGRKKYEGEPRNIYNNRMVLVWCKSLKKAVPLSTSLAVCYLACHIAREPILPTDIVRWTIEGKLPYFSTFTKIEKFMEKLDRSIKNIEIVVSMPDRPIMNVTVSIDRPSIACPLTASSMFRPSQAVPVQKLESMAACIAESVCLSLPPVNFYAITSRFLKLLHLPLGKILPYVCRIYEWAMPPELWLSANELRVPTRVCVMSILIVAIRILYNINGFGKWEKSLCPSDRSPFVDEHSENSDSSCGSNAKDDAEEGWSTSDELDAELEECLSSVHNCESDAAELLQNLERRYNELNDRYGYSKDLPTYLEYCREVVFAGSFEGSEQEAGLIEKLWNFYQKNQEDIETSVSCDDSGPNQKGLKDGNEFLDTTMEEGYEHSFEETSSASRGGEFPCTNGSSSMDDAPQTSQSNKIPDQTVGSNEKYRDVAIRHLKIDMEEHRFYYIPPREREKAKRNDYLLYVRKKGDGSLNYVAHADYYILLRACAKAAHVDVRVMHIGVLTLERRLAWIEKKIDHSLQKICSIHRDASDFDAPPAESCNL